MYNTMLEYPSAWLFHSHGVFPARTGGGGGGAMGPSVGGCGGCDDWMYHAPTPTEVTKSSRRGYWSHGGSVGLCVALWEEWEARRRGVRSGSVRVRRLRARLGGGGEGGEEREGGGRCV